MIEVRQHQSRTAFTLVELLVVIGIIALLISILLPVVARARRSANDVKCRSNLHQVALATRMYENDHFDHLPDGYTLGGAPVRVLPGMLSPGDPAALPEIYGMPALYKDRGYLKSLEVWKCPSARYEVQEWGNTYIWDLPGGTDINRVKDTGISNVARWTSQRRGRPENQNRYFVYDNYTTLPWTSASRKTSGSVSTFTAGKQILPHDYKVKTISGSRQGSFNVCFVDGHVGVVVFSLTPTGGTKTDFLRDP